MLTPEKARRLDPSLANISDEELITAIEQLYDLGQLVFEQWQADGYGSKRPLGLLASGQDKTKIKP